MSKIRHTKDTHRRALELVGKGITYEAIREKLGVPKSTLSVWVSTRGKKPDRTKQIAHLKRARKLATATLSFQKSQRILQAITSAEQTARILLIEKIEINKSLLAMLYWAEGGKQEGNMKFTNTDADLVQLFLSLLRKSYRIEEARLRVALQIHSYHDKNEAISFWSRKLRIPKNQFWKPYLKPRSGRREYRRNFHGICNLHYASTPIQRELLALGKTLAKRYL
jgi:hypothetical protein